MQKHLKKYQGYVSLIIFWNKNTQKFCLLQNSSDVIFKPFKLYIDWNILFQAVL